MPAATAGHPRSLAAVTQKSLVFLLDHCVTFAGPLLEPGPIQRRYAPSRIPDQPICLQLAGGFRDALAAHPQHVGDQELPWPELDRLIGLITRAQSEEIARQQAVLAKVREQRKSKTSPIRSTSSTPCLPKLAAPTCVHLFTLRAAKHAKLVEQCRA
jgi:hypothetical protein